MGRHPAPCAVQRAETPARPSCRYSRRRTEMLRALLRLPRVWPAAFQHRREAWFADITYVRTRTYDSREQAAQSLFEYIEAFYNRIRIHSALGWLSPAEFEERHAKENRPEAA